MNILIITCLLVSLTNGQVEVTLPFSNPAGVTLTGAGFANTFNFQPLTPLAPQPSPTPQQYVAEQPQPVAQAQPLNAFTAEPTAAPVPSPAPIAYGPAKIRASAYAPVAPLQYHRAVQYAAPAPAPVVPHHKIAYAAQPAVAVHQKIGYAATPVVTNVPGVADVPVTKLAYSPGYTQHEVDVAQPAVSTRKVKVRRPALRKEFYDIEHRVIVRPAGSATLELSQPISKEQQGPAVLTPTKFAHIAPVVRYGASRRIVDGTRTDAAAVRSAPETLSASPAPAPEQPAIVRASPFGQRRTFQRQRGFPPQQESPEPRQALAGDEDTTVVEAVQGPGSPREDLPNESQSPAPMPPQQPQEQPINEQPQPIPEGGPSPSGNDQGLTITPDMPLALQNRLLELLTAKGGTVTEILNKDGTPADSASVLQVADALGDPQLQGGERITTRRIVVTRPIETIQEIEVQEPATKLHRKIVQQPALFKHHVPAVARVPVNVPAVKHVATPFVKTTYASAAAPLAAVPAHKAYAYNY